MKNRIFRITLLLCWAGFLGAGALTAQTTGRLRVCGQNMQNYYINYDNYQSTRANYGATTFANKTRKIVNAFLEMDADIYALCEVEACALVLEQLADSLNKYAGEDVYAAVKDGINVPWDSYDNNLKSGFIYRLDKVKPYKSNTAASNWNYYKNTMRIQAFEELSSGERLVVSMNHFKAKTGDGGESTRLTNADHLINALKKSLGDPDILILGDLNCTVEEEPLKRIIKAGYEEQILRFEPDAYSHCYKGSGDLIDHALANASMSEQIVYAYVNHICTTSCGVNNATRSYSDHDPCIVEINLGDDQAIEAVSSQSSAVSYKILRDGVLLIIRGDKVYTITGQVVQ